MPYPESCPECGGAFRNTGTHYTARRNEVGRHILLELGCQNTSRRYWWDFTTGTPAEDGTTPGRKSIASEQRNGSIHAETNGHARLATLEPPPAPPTNGHHHPAEDRPTQTPEKAEDRPTQTPEKAENRPTQTPEKTEAEAAPPMETLTRLTFDLPRAEPEARPLETTVTPPNTSPALKEAFVRQLQLDRLTLRQMRSWLMSEEARRSIEVAAGATEATYERLALILFGADLPQLLGKQAAPPASPGMSAEERLELQREKARIRARLRRAAAKAAREQSAG